MNIEAFDLNLLKALVAIYEERQITQAASRLGITQPGLSHALARLRGTFGDELFLRRAGGMVPTAMAEDLYARIRPGLELLHDGIASPVDPDPKSLSRTFVLGMNDYGAHVILPVLIRQLARVAPGVRLKTRHYPHGTQFDDLRAGTIDLSVSVAGPHPGWVNSEALFTETARVVASVDNPILKNGLTLETYVRCPHVIMAANGEDRNWVDDHLADLGLARTVQHALPHFLTIPAILRGSNMISTLPGRIAAGLGKQDGLQTFDLPFAAPLHQIVQLWPKRLDRDPVLKWLRATIMSVVT